MIGKMSSPTNSWTNQSRVNRSSESLWGASRLSCNPKLFIPNCLRPAAFALAEHTPKNRQDFLLEFSETHFKSMADVDQIVSFNGLDSVVIDEKHLRCIQSRPSHTAEAARIIIKLNDARIGYIEPNLALISRRPVSEGRGDTQLIENHLKWLASLAIGEEALTMPIAQKPLT